MSHLCPCRLIFVSSLRVPDCCTTDTSQLAWPGTRKQGHSLPPGLQPAQAPHYRRQGPPGESASTQPSPPAPIPTLHLFRASPPALHGLPFVPRRPSAVACSTGHVARPLLPSTQAPPWPRQSHRQTTWRHCCFGLAGWPRLRGTVAHGQPPSASKPRLCQCLPKSQLNLLLLLPSELSSCVCDAAFTLSFVLVLELTCHRCAVLCTSSHA
ncbi:uncharacterized protein B0I36DRAFT_89474 [Microdochium trichocladiopsis]|uniref:Uncharacterized protein n=1 Tax=Microdochium trichocladiopsis TaxID=1682393 RepID=A0A9P9BT28_9PEZI|nr:uncharacterized protein B0I36DRAFT_89474 [Microdochium trichocladiopsis]KAH7035204.1 hypothetical protein B0I36DRAFT_89474 [Microdochium trichocladiopsis]